MRHIRYAVRGLTLTELLVATSLVGVVAMAAVNSELGARHYFLLDRRRAVLTNEGVYALEHMTRMIRRSVCVASGGSQSPRASGGSLLVRLDNASSMTQRTPNNPTDDMEVTYRFSNGQLIYNNGADEVIARYVDTANSSFAFTPGSPIITLMIVTTTQGESITQTTRAAMRFRL